MHWENNPFLLYLIIETDVFIVYVEYSVWSPAGFDRVLLSPSHNSTIGALGDIVHICSLLYPIYVLY